MLPRLKLSFHMPNCAYKFPSKAILILCLWCNSLFQFSLHVCLHFSGMTNTISFAKIQEKDMLMMTICLYDSSHIGCLSIIPIWHSNHWWHKPNLKDILIMSHWHCKFVYVIIWVVVLMLSSYYSYKIFTHFAISLIDYFLAVLLISCVLFILRNVGKSKGRT